MSTVETIIASIDAKIAAIIADPESIADYKIGDKTVNRSKILDLLIKAREKYLSFAENEPYENIRHIAFDTDAFGYDESEMFGDKQG